MKKELFSEVRGYGEIKKKLILQEKERSKIIIIPEKRKSFRLFEIVKNNSENVLCIPDLKMYTIGHEIPDNAILALAFSTLEKFDPKTPITEQTNISADILNKFDIIFIAVNRESL